MIDLHNHIIRYIVPIHPRTEPDPEVAVRMAQLAAADGIRIIVSTPHLRAEHMRENWVPRLAEGVAQLNELLRQRGVPVEVVSGAEVQLVEQLPQLAAAGWLPTLGAGRHLLIELPLSSYATWAEQVLFELALQGYVPVLAHFERQAAAAVRTVDARTLVERGYKLQVNCESLRGRRGPQVAALARRLIREGLAAALGSDAHNATDQPPLLSPCRQAVERAGGRGAFARLSWELPLQIIRP